MFAFADNSLGFDLFPWLPATFCGFDECVFWADCVLAFADDSFGFILGVEAFAGDEPQSSIDNFF